MEKNRKPENRGDVASASKGGYPHRFLPADGQKSVLRAKLKRRSKASAPKARSGHVRAQDAFEVEAFGAKPEADPLKPRKVRKQAEGISEKHTRRKKRRVKDAWWAAPIAVAMMAILVLLSSFMVAEVRGYASFLNKKHSVSRATFYPGVSMEGVDLSSMTLEDALTEWGVRDQRAKDALNISLVLDGQRWAMDADALGYSSDYQQVLMSAWSVGRYGTLEERYQVVSKLPDTDWRREFQPTRSMDEGVAMTKLSALADSLSTPAVNAKVANFDIDEKTFTFTDSRVGQVVDAKELLSAIKDVVASGSNTVNIVRREVVPKDTARTLSETYGVIATASTDASSSNSNRLTNLKVACKTLNGVRVEPGETFSFNGTLGKRTTKAGYRPAGAYENGITTNQVGGGICQVSTTLFNAVAKADMKIVERSPHSRPSSYVGLGKDAAVNWPNQDFKFTNTSNYPIYITAQLTSKKKVNMAVYGKKLAGGLTIKIESEKTHTYPAGGNQVTRDPNLLPGEKVVVEAARDGYSAVTYRVYLDANGKEIKKVQLCKSYYAPSGAIIRVGE